MIRGAFGAFDAIVGTRGVSGMAGRLAGRQLGARKISTKTLQGPVPWHHRMGTADVSQLWNRRPMKPTRLYSQTRMVFRAPRRPFHSSKARNSAAEGAKKEPESLSLSGRLKKLSREYGWAAVGIYLGLSVLDFPFCFLLVRTLGTERIAVAEEFVVSNVQKAIPERAKAAWHDYRKSLKEAESEVVGNDDISKGVEAAGWGVKEADERNKSEPSLATQLALAYAIHKSFIFLRVPLTAAVTPKVVKVLRSWGWQIGKRRPKA